MFPERCLWWCKSIRLRHLRQALDEAMSELTGMHLTDPRRAVKALLIVQIEDAIDACDEGIEA